MTDLKLIALEAEDLAVLSAHLQDAVVTLGDIAYLPGEKRFAALFNRFDWSAAQDLERVSGSETQGPLPDDPAYLRRRTAFRLERVSAARLKDIDLADRKRVLNLLAIQFEPRAPDDPSGFVSLIFAGDAAIRLEVECIEAEMRDLGGAWATTSRPEHADDRET